MSFETDSNRIVGRAVEKASAGNFAPAWRCIEELSRQLQCTPSDAGKQIARYCRGRLIDARCANIWWEVKDRYGTTEYEEDNSKIPPWFWEHCTSHPDTVLDWKSGVFSGRGYVDGESYVVRIKGAEFDVAGIIDLEAMLFAETQAPTSPVVTFPTPADSTTSTSTPRTGRPRSEKWADWIAELVACIHEQGFPAGKDVEGQDELIAQIEQRMMDRNSEGPARSTVQPVIRAVLQRLREAEK